MRVIAVDDEELMLRALVRAVSSSPDIADVAQFSNADDASALWASGSSGRGASCSSSTMKSYNAARIRG